MNTTATPNRAAQLLELIENKKAGTDRQQALRELANLAAARAGRAPRSLYDIKMILDLDEPKAF